MRRLFSQALGGLVVFTTLVVLARGLPAPQAQSDLAALFNGQDLSGWTGMPAQEPAKLAALPEDQRKAQLEKWTAEAKDHWKVDKGQLVNIGKEANLATTKSFGDVELLLEYQTTDMAEGGVCLRGTPQVQIGGDQGSGGLPGQKPQVRADKGPGEWNALRIVQVGERTTVHLNDKLVVDHARMPNTWDAKLPLPRQGPILLTVKSGEIRWRNIRLREIPSPEANEILRKHGAEGFVDVFNGKDFTGWAGPVDQYEVKDGAIVCLPKKGGTIYTQAEYSDFLARVEYRLPPAGNNGLAIRYPGKGDTAYVGMCEIQVLDDTAPVYAKLDPRQYNGSVYGIVAAHRGYLRPVGEWNFYDVAVKGSTIKVELNGTVIVDTDVSTVTKYMGDRPHPGKDRKSGHFGFAGHNDPVAFRNIQIKRLDQ
jgi:hypothetical protein